METVLNIETGTHITVLAVVESWTFRSMFVILSGLLWSLCISKQYAWNHCPMVTEHDCSNC
jgi:hypothetical protein